MDICCKDSDYLLRIFLCCVADPSEYESVSIRHAVLLQRLEVVVRYLQLVQQIPGWASRARDYFQ